MEIKKINKGIVGSLFLLFSLALISTASFASNEDELKRIEEQLRSEKLKLKEVKAKETSALNKLYKVSRDLNEAKTDLEHTKTGIYEGRKKIGSLNEELIELDAQIKFGSKKLVTRISEAYKSGRGLNFLELLFSSRSVADFLNRGYYLEKLIAADATLMSDLKASILAAEKAKVKLKGTIEEMRVLAVRMDRRKLEIEEDATEKKSLYNLLHARRLEYERRVAELEKSSRQFESLILKAEGRVGGGTKGSGRMIYPASGRIISGYGYRRHPIWGGFHLHTGIDIAAAFGEPVRAADSGEVIFSGWWDGYGKAIVIDHGRGLSTVYGHMSRLYAEAGQRMEKGQIVGLVGSTGFSTGPHLHFEVRRSGKPVDPVGFLF